jgi:hypothetical protein
VISRWCSSGATARLNVKCRTDGFKRLYQWLATHDFLIVKADNNVPLIVLRLEEAQAIAAIAERCGAMRPLPSLPRRRRAGERGVARFQPIR